MSTILSSDFVTGEYKAKVHKKYSPIRYLCERMLDQCVSDIRYGGPEARFSCREFVKCGGHEFYCEIANISPDNFMHYVMTTTADVRDRQQKTNNSKPILIRDTATGEEYSFLSMMDASRQMAGNHTAMRKAIRDGRLYRRRYAIMYQRCERCETGDTSFQCTCPLGKNIK